MDGFGQKKALEHDQSSRAHPEAKQAGVRFTIDPYRRLVIARFGRRLTAIDIQTYVQGLHDHPSFNPSFSEIADISDVKELPLEAPDFLRLADSVDPFSLESKRAFVAKTTVQMHAARMHKILRSQRNFEIFRTLEEAKHW
ncbi:MAG TPA: hypothetical protein VE866_03080, partial [Candidatus Binatia bacterium]|nr:hypothetical protein [Candidatus Binatia bacterium]